MRCTVGAWATAQARRVLPPPILFPLKSNDDGRPQGSIRETVVVVVVQFFKLSLTYCLFDVVVSIKYVGSAVLSLFDVLHFYGTRSLNLLHKYFFITMVLIFLIKFSSLYYTATIVTFLSKRGMSSVEGSSRKLLQSGPLVEKSNS